MSGSNHPLGIVSVEPEFGVNYGVGYVGFTYTRGSVVSEGIAHFTRWSRMSDIYVSHALVVVSKTYCVEALMEGVQKTRLRDYFEDESVQIFFRKPFGYTRDLGKRIAASALEQVGTEYDSLLIAAQALQGSFLGRFINGLFADKPDRLVSRLLNADDRWICSELASHCLDRQRELADRGILAEPVYTIDPQELFEDDQVFTPWHPEVSKP